MKFRFYLVLAFAVLTLTGFGQAKEKNEKWEWLLGEWKGEGDGQPGKGDGTFSFVFDLDKRIILRKSHSVYPATGSKPEIVHDDLMIVYPAGGPDFEKAIYFDNEGHVIEYAISYSEKAIILTSLKVGNAPVFRLTYELLKDGKVNTKFEMSADGQSYMTYIEGVSAKTN